MSVDTLRWKLAREFGWTLEYIDTLTLADLEEYGNFDAVTEGARKARDYMRREREAHKFRGK